MAKQECRTKAPPSKNYMVDKKPFIKYTGPYPAKHYVVRNTMFQILLVIGTICAFEQTLIVVLLQNEKHCSICIKAKIARNLRQ